jgi:hypothetical protein
VQSGSAPSESSWYELTAAVDVAQLQQHTDAPLPPSPAMLEVLLAHAVGSAKLKGGAADGDDLWRSNSASADALLDSGISFDDDVTGFAPVASVSSVESMVSSLKPRDDDKTSSVTSAASGGPALPSLTKSKSNKHVTPSKEASRSSVPQWPTPQPNPGSRRSDDGASATLPSHPPRAHTHSRAPTPHRSERPDCGGLRSHVGVLVTLQLTSWRS